MEVLKILSQKSNNLFQADAWADFSTALDKKSWIIKDDRIEGLIIKQPLHKLAGDKCYLYSPRGPVVKDKVRLQDLKVFLRKVEALAKEERAVFYRIEPYSGIDSRLRGNDKVLDFKKISKHAPLSLQHSPLNTFVLDITKPDDKLLADMKPKWRYNINLAKRKGIKVREGKTLKDIKVFYELTKEMEKRGGYKGHEYEYYEKMHETLGQRGKGSLDSSLREVARDDKEDNSVLKLFIAEYEGKPLAAILVSYFGQVATYLHGASSNERRELMPTYLLQWHAICEAQKRGCKVYDFWGVAPKNAKNHPWAGISRFKRGFGGEDINFDGVYDLVFEKRYYTVLSGVNRIRKMLRK